MCRIFPPAGDPAMVKGVVGARLLRSLLKSGTVQRRTTGKLWTSLFAAVPSSKKSPATSRSKAPAAPKAVAQRSAARSAPAAVRSVAKPLPGKWLASYLSASSGLDAAIGRMSYYLYLPDRVPDAAARDGLPLLVMMHGCQQNASQFAQGTRMNLLAERAGYAVLYPQQAASRQAQRCWKWYDRATQHGAGDVTALVAIIEKVVAQYAFDRTRIYIAGMSAGAAMANIVALNHPDLIAAVGLHSGPVFGAGHSVVDALGVMQHGAAVQAGNAVRDLLLRDPQFPGMPTILIQGLADRVVRPVNQGQLAQQSLQLNGLSALSPPKVTLTPASRNGSRNAHQVEDFYVDRKVRVRVVQIAQLEHAWSGGDASLAFNAEAGPDASKMMLDFFAKHRRLIV